MVHLNGARKQGDPVRVLVAATGTDLGKTHIACALLRHWRAEGLDPLPLKPLQSGFELGAADTSDAGLLLAAAGLAVDEKGLDRVAPWRYRAALSPDLAAAREGRGHGFEEVVAFCRGAAETHQGPLLVETAGGVMSPLTAEKTMLDLAAELNFPVLLVAGGYLGTISHTLTALAAARSLPLAGLVLNARADDGVPLEDTIAAIRRHHPDLAIVAWRENRSEKENAAETAALL